MKKFLLAVLFSVFSNICVEASQEEDNRKYSSIFCINELREKASAAEQRLNEENPSQLCTDTMTIFKYLEFKDWNHEEIAQKYDIEVTSIKKFLGGYLLCGTMLSHVHRYYAQGGGSVIGVLPPHKQQTNWVDSMMSWFCGHHDPQEHHQQKIIKTQ